MSEKPCNFNGGVLGHPAGAVNYKRRQDRGRQRETKKHGGGEREQETVTADTRGGKRRIMQK